MTDGYRDAFIENDSSVIGNYDRGTNFLGSVKSFFTRKKRKKNKSATRHTRRRKRKSRRRTRSHRRNKKMRKRSKGGIHYTKKGQPYRIMSNGRARFIKK